MGHCFGHRAWLTSLGLCAALSWFFPESTHAQSRPQVAPGFLLDRYAPAVAGSQWFGAESLDFRGNVRPAVRAVLSTNRDPFVVTSPDGESQPVVSRQTYLHLGLSLNLWDHVRFAADLPVAIDKAGQASAPVNGIVYPGPGDEGFGDVRASIDVKLWGKAGAPAVLALGIQAFFPTEVGRYSSDGFVRFMPRALFAGDLDRFTYALSLGFLSRDQLSGEWFGGDGIGHELAFTAAAGVRPHDRVLLGAELLGYTAVTGGGAFSAERSPMELIFGAHVHLPYGFALAVGGGPGLTSSLGAPSSRFLARVQWLPGFEPEDYDRDGVPDTDDACPTIYGARTAVPATHGCPPPPDRDRDRILDGVDACPDDPGVASDRAVQHGCPPPRDRDGDGIFDPADACPDQPGGKTDDPATSGCAAIDADADGITDVDDACPQQPGPPSDDQRTTGCADTDGDTVRDPVDACPEVPGKPSADVARAGCPEARIDGGQLQIRDQVRFRSGSADLLPESAAVLSSVATLLKEHPDISHVRVEGHTDNRGGKALNRRLSARRASAVRRWLITNGGIEASRISSVGLGMDRPLPGHADNATDESRTANRRVEFHIARPVPDGPPPASP
jgi:OOP family OmpA-OmpF porin